jgi:S-adenosylmethionine:tRNA-ribosyltransferase-isomerase (queuine synthetase)
LNDFGRRSKEQITSQPTKRNKPEKLLHSKTKRSQTRKNILNKIPKPISKNDLKIVPKTMLKLIENYGQKSGL